MIRTMEYAIEGTFSVPSVVEELLAQVEVPKQFARS
jgi:hypothetical protein